MLKLQFYSSTFSFFFFAKSTKFCAADSQSLLNTQNDKITLLFEQMAKDYKIRLILIPVFKMNVKVQCLNYKLIFCADNSQSYKKDHKKR